MSYNSLFRPSARGEWEKFGAAIRELRQVGYRGYRVFETAEFGLDRAAAARLNSRYGNDFKAAA